MIPGPPGGPLSDALAHPVRVAPTAGGRNDKAAKGPPALNATPDLIALFKALQHRWPMAMALGLACGVVAVAVAWKVVPKPKYRATVLLQVSAQKPKVLLETSEAIPEFRVYQATHLALIKSRLVLNTALKRPGVAELESVRSQADPVEWLEGRIKAELPSGSELLQISINGDRPEELATLVNAVADAYMEEIVTREYNDRLVRYERLNDLLLSYQDKLTAKRANLRKLAESVGSDNQQTLALKQQFAIQQLSQERGELLHVQSELKRGRVELAVLESAESAKSEVPIDEAEVEAQLEKDAVVERLKAQIDRLVSNINRTRNTLRDPNDPSLKRYRSDLVLARKSMDEARAKLRPMIEAQLRDAGRGDRPSRLAELRTQVRVLNDYEEVLKEGVERLGDESRMFTSKTLDLKSMQDEIESGEATAKKINTEVEALSVELKAPHRVKLIERAEVPRVENANKRLMSIGMAGLGAFGAVVMGVSWREFRTRRVASADEVVHGLGMRLMGTLPALPARSRGRDAAQGPGEPRWQNLLIESIDAARTMLLRDLHAESLRSVMITSATKGEGKSSLSSHLAISLARTGRRTLLIDFDLRSPSVHRLFDVPQDPGVCELLRDEAVIDEVVQPVMGELDVIAAGRCNAESIRALAQDRLPRLLAELEERYDFIVVDSAPVLPVADSLLISQHVDAVLLSVFRDVSRMPAVYAGYERLTSLGARVLGTVVTGIPLEQYGNEYRYESRPGR